MNNSLLNKLKKDQKRLQENSGGGFGEKVEWFKPQDGDNMIRILPNKDDPENGDVYYECNVHFMPIRTNSGQMISIPVRCLQDVKEDCPACNEYNRLVKTARNDDDKERARAIRPGQRFLFNIIDYKAQKVLPWAASSNIFQDIAGFAIDLGNEDGNAFDLKSGRDWKLIRGRNPKKKGNLAIEYKIRPASKDTALPTKLMPLVDQAKELANLYSVEEARKKLAEMFGSKAEPEDDEEDERAGNFDEEDEEDDYRKSLEDEEEDLPPTKAPPASIAKAKAAAAAAKAKAPAKPAPKAKPKDEDEVEEDEDEDLEKELRDLGVMDD